MVEKVNKHKQCDLCQLDDHVETPYCRLAQFVVSMKQFTLNFTFVVKKTKRSAPHPLPST